MLFQGHLDAPAYRTSSQVGPRFGNSRSLYGLDMMPLHHVRGCYPIQTASCILFRHLKSLEHIDMLSIGTRLQPYTIILGNS